MQSSNVYFVFQFVISLNASNKTNPWTVRSDASVNVWAASGARDSPGVDSNEFTIFINDWISTITEAQSRRRSFICYPLQSYQCLPFAFGALCANMIVLNSKGVDSSNTYAANGAQDCGCSKHLQS
jgi:hypothetical protein